jgi:ferric iron reductase protein FhuF
MIYPGLSFSEEKKQKADKKTRAKVHYVLNIDLKDNLAKMFSEPIKNLQEKILTDIERDNSIKIERSSMVKTDKCLGDLLTSISHLVKVSTGNNIIRARIELTSETSTKSVWTRWHERKLESPELKMTLFYNSKDVEPTEIICAGYKYY